MKRTLPILAALMLFGCSPGPDYKLEVKETPLTNGVHQVALYSKKGDSNYYILGPGSNYVRTQWAITNR